MQVKGPGSSTGELLRKKEKTVGQKKLKRWKLLVKRGKMTVRAWVIETVQKHKPGQCYFGGGHKEGFCGQAQKL